MSRNLTVWAALVSMTGVALLGCAGALRAQVKPTVGSRNVAIADPPIPRPSTTPCIVQLFPREDFGPAGENTRMDAVPHAFKYQPPAECKGRWAQVVLEADFSVDPGRQYDRTASIWLNGVNLYFGTTEEPSADFGPSWQVTRDLTDYSSLLRSPGAGVALVNNWVDSMRKSVIHASAKLLFYPADSSFPAPRTPDAVYALNVPGHVPANLQSGNDPLSRKIVFPKNTERVYLDVFAQSQFHDEFWYTCLPEKYIQQTTAFAMRRGYKGAPRQPRACSGGSYREVEVSVDGQPAGLAPTYPWVYTGGIDPFLWRPTPGVQTLDFVPFRLDLTPFAGLLSDGAPHSVSVRVLGANHYFSVAAALLIYRDARLSHTGGAVTRNTLAGASLEPAITGTLGTGAEGVNGDVLTRAKQSYVIEGYVNTHAGRVRTKVDESITFANTQRFITGDAKGRRHVTEQAAHVETTSGSERGSKAATALHRSFDYALTVDVLRRSSPDGTNARTVSLDQHFEKKIERTGTGSTAYTATIRNARTTSDALTFNPAHRGQFSDTNQSSTQIFDFTDSLGDCYRATVEARGGKVSSFSQGEGCGTKPVRWFVHPNGWPGSFEWLGNASR